MSVDTNVETPVTESDENVDETVEETEETTEETEKESPEALIERLEIDDTDVHLITKADKAIVSYNEAVTALKELSGDIDEVTEAVKTSDDPEIVSLRTKAEAAKTSFEKAQLKLDEAAKVKAEAKIAETTDVAKQEELKATVEKLTKRIKATKNLLKAEYGDEVLAVFKEMLNQKGTGAATGRGAGVARPRNFTVTVDGKVAVMKNNNKEEVSSFSAAAKELGGIPTQNVQAGYFASEGTDAEAWTPGKTISYNVVGSDGKEHPVTATKNRDK